MPETRYSPQVEHVALAELIGEDPDSEAFVFLARDGKVAQRVTRAELMFAAAGYAEALVDYRGARVILLAATGLEFVAGFLGCLQTGAVAVPVPPAIRRARLRAIAQDCTATGVIGAVSEGLAGAADLTRISPCEVVQRDCIVPSADDLAFLQYTSGSTGAPKGVRVRHGDIARNAAAITERFAMSAGDTIVSWLPLFHDMGLMGTVLQTLFSGGRSVLMAPEAFLRRPALWPETIARFGGTVSGAPDFGYDLTWRSVSKDEAAGLDLSTWRAAFNGAEMVRPATLTRFAGHFAPAGFCEKAFLPSYGLAEATLLAAAEPAGNGAHVARFDRVALESGIAQEAAQGLDLVASGRPGLGSEICILDPDNGARLPAGRLGEIELSKGSLADGYWGQQSQEFSQGRFCTGDLGFFHKDRLYVVGRKDDLIHLRGRNILPGEVEACLVQAETELRAGQVMLIAPKEGSQKRLVALIECEGAPDAEAPVRLRGTIQDRFGLALDEILWIRKGTLPRTTSGKPQRSVALARYDEDGFSVLARSVLANTRLAEVLIGDAPMQSRLCEALALWCGLAPGSVTPDQTLSDLGLESLAAVRLLHDLEATLGLRLGLDAALSAPDIATLADRLEAAEAPTTVLGESIAPTLSPNQKALWLVQDIAPESAAYTIAEALHLTGTLVPDMLHTALDTLVNRHEQLRCNLVLAEAGLEVQTHAPARGCAFAFHDASDWGDAQVQAALEHRARVPFDLGSDRLLRADVYRLTPSEHILLISVHHAVCDLWSMALLVKELDALLNKIPLPDAQATFSDHLRASTSWCAGPAAQVARDWYSNELAGDLPHLALSHDRLRPARSAFQGGRVHFQLPAEIGQALGDIAAQAGTTLHNLLLSAWALFLRRASDQDDVLLGVPVADRTRAFEADVVGYLVNLGVLRSRARLDQPFTGFLAKTTHLIESVLRHGTLPLADIVSSATPERGDGHGALFQSVFNYNGPGLPGDAGLAASGLIAGRKLALGPFQAKTMVIETGATQFDLTCTMASETDGTLLGALQYDSALFEVETVAGFASAFVALMAGIAREPGCHAAALPLMNPTEKAAWHALAKGPEADCGVDFRLNFEAQVRHRPDAIAVRDTEMAWSYAALNRYANALANTLVSHGAGPGRIVAVRGARGAPYLGAMLAIAKAGACYMPLSPRDPEARLATILDQTCPVVILSDGSLPLPEVGSGAGGAVVLPLASTPPAVSTADPPSRVRGQDSSYVIFTSGSTGVPKGAVVHGEGNSNHLEAMVDLLELDANDVMAQTASVASDISVWQFLVMATVGGRVEVFEDALVEQPAEFLQALETRGVTVLQAVPAVLEVLAVELERPGAPPPPRLLRWVSSCGEALAPALARRWMAAVPDARLINAFGPAECSDDTSVALFETPPSADAVTVSIGRPLRNLACYVLDRHGQPLPSGMTGELWIGGRGVGLGYLNEPRRTAEAFGPDPFSTTPGARLYRTSDLARRRADGTLDYLGRRDSQVNIRGFRVEIGEIEAALRAIPGLRHAAVDLYEGSRKALVAWYAPADIDFRELHQALSKRLPGFMLPERWVPMAALPFNSSGKIDRKALPAPLENDDGPIESPVTEAERILAAIWQERLGRGSVGRHHSFFELGGHSLMAIQMIADIRAQSGLRLNLRDVFEAPRLCDLALRLINAESSVGIDESAWPPVRQTGSVPLSAAQRRMWFLHQLAPEDVSYSMTGILRFDGPLDRHALKGALQDLIARHRTLRMAVETSSTGEPLLAVTEPPELTYSNKPAEQIAASEAITGFDLAVGPVLRLTLTEEPQGPALVIAVHHIAFDGWSIAVFLKDLSALYRARIDEGAIPAPLAYDFVDYAAWSETHWSHETLERALKARAARFGSGLTPLDLPYDGPDVGPGPRPAGLYQFEIPSGLAANLQQLAARSDTTAFLTLLAGFQTLLSRVTGSERFDLGTLTAGRDRAGMDQLIGLLLNTLPVPADLSGNPDGYELLARIKRDWLDLQAFADVPFDALVAAETAERGDPAQAGLNCFFVLQNQPTGPRDLGGGVCMTLNELIPANAPYDLLLDIEPKDAGYVASFRYCAGRFDPATIEALGRAYLSLLNGLVSTPEQPVADLPMLNKKTWSGIYRTLSGVSEPLPGDGAHFPALFAQTALQNPEALAAADFTEQLNYRDLLDQADRVGAALQARGLGPEDIVGVHGRRSVAMLVALLGILRAGAAYLPLDPDDAPTRLADMLSETGSQVVLTCGVAPGSALCEGREVLDVDVLRKAATGILQTPTIGAQTLAYVIYTSGSTGRPKGAMVTHEGMLNHLWAKVVDLGLVSEDTVAETAPQSFDVSIWQFLSALLIGGNIYVFDEPTAVDPMGLIEGLAREGITVAETVPGLLRAMSDAQDVGTAIPLPVLRWMLVTGEALQADSAGAWLDHYPEVPLMNAYGPTECSDDVTHHVISCVPVSERPMPIGKTILNTQLYVLDHRLHPLPQGAAGRLWVGGIGVGRGYVSAPGKTAMVFRPDPFDTTLGARMYDTGDIVRLNADGDLVYLGRSDHQVKLAGRRIEPGEIETCLRRLPFVRDCVVLPRGPRLVAYAVLRDPPHRAEARLVAYAAQHLPRYMVPAGVVTLDVLPRTANGKLDRAALPDWQPEAETNANTTPATETERALVALARDVLEGIDLPPTADFFTMGGTSLQAMQLIALTRKHFSVAFPLASFYRAPNLRALAKAIDTGAPIIPAVPQTLPQGDQPLTPAQERLWMLGQLEGDAGSGVYTIVSPLRLSGPLDVMRLETALSTVVAAHPALRLTFVETPQGPRQRVCDPGPATLIVDGKGALDDDALRIQVEAEAAQPFDLENGPLIRARLLRQGPEEAVLMIALHHIVADGGSMDFLLRDLALAYSGEPLAPYEMASLPVLKTSIRDAGSVVQRLKGLPPFLDLPIDRADYASSDMRAGHTGFWLEPDQLARLDDICRKHSVTRFMALSALVSAVLGKVAGREDMMFGTDTAGRDVPDSQSAVSFLVNQVPIRLNLSGDPDLATLLKRGRAATLDAFEDQDIPFQDVVRAVGAPRKSGRLPVFQLKIIDRGVRPESVQAGALLLCPYYGAEPRVETDLLVDIAEIGGRLRLWLCYRTQLFDAARVETWRDAFENALVGILKNPDGWNTGKIQMPKTPATSSTPVRPAFRRTNNDAKAICPEVLLPPVSGTALINWLRETRSEIDDHIHRASAVILRGAGIADVSQFEAAAACLSHEMILENGEHEVVDTSDVVQTPVSYPADVPLRAHNENTFNRIWPGRIMFACLTPAETGGETTVLDGRRVYQAMPQALRDRFACEGIRYRRVYQPGLERSWQEVFGTSDPVELARACAAEKAELSWQGDVPVTEAWRPAVARHPVTGELSWVGQVPIWHPACHDPETTAALRAVFAADALPRTCRFGNGDEIPDEDAQQIARLCAAFETPIPWAQGDMAVVDNLLAAHGRRPYTGHRHLLVALSNPIESDTVGVRV